MHTYMAGVYVIIWCVGIACICVRGVTREYHFENNRIPRQTTHKESIDREAPNIVLDTLQQCAQPTDNRIYTPLARHFRGQLLSIVCVCLCVRFVCLRFYDSRDIFADGYCLRFDDTRAIRTWIWPIFHFISLFLDEMYIWVRGM